MVADESGEVGNPGTLGACDFFNLACSLWLESWEEHLPTSIAGVPSASLRGCDFFNFPCSLWPESSEEHLPASIAEVPSATLRTGSSTPRDKPSVMR